MKVGVRSKKVKWYTLGGCLKNIAYVMIFGGFKNLLHFLWKLEIDKKTTIYGIKI